MTEGSFVEMLKREGFIKEGESLMSQDTVTKECEKILEKRSSLSSGAREIFMGIKNIMLLRKDNNDKSLRLPWFVEDGISEPVKETVDAVQ